MILYIHRKDLRITDLPAFDRIHHLGVSSLHLHVLDPCLLRNDRHLEHSGRSFLRQVGRLDRMYREAGASLLIAYGEPERVVGRLLELHSVAEILWHREFTPYARLRDRKLVELAEARGITAMPMEDHTLVDLFDLQAYSGRTEPYKVFTPFYRKWREFVGSYYRPSSGITLRDLCPAEPDPKLAEEFPLPWDLRSFGEPEEEPSERLNRFVEEKLPSYEGGRDRYASDFTSGMSAYLNTGAISARQVYEEVMDTPLNGPWVRQLAWRDFYHYQAFYDPSFFRYEDLYDFELLSDRHFSAWCAGETGIPIIDAAMRQLSETGELPNRLRMIAAMFLTKNLLCPFPLGEQFFRSKLADYDNVLNRGGWLWSSSLGFDPAPYFRIMNPVTQSQTHDPAGWYIRRWMPELAGLSDREIHLPRPHAIVDLKASRARAIEVYKEILSNRTSPGIEITTD